MEPETPALSLSGVRKTFGSKVAVEGLDLVVPRGSLYGFIGPNGAGKTTTIRMIMSILFPDEGELQVLGKASALEAKDRIGYLPEERGVYRKMKVGSFLRYIGHLKGLGGQDLKQRVSGWLERVGLSDVEGKPCEELSKGMQQKVQFIAAVLHRPELLILDEPFSGLDPVNMRLLRDLIQELFDGGMTIIFSTHVMQQAEDLCDHIVMIHDGRKMLDDHLETLRSRQDPRRVLFEPLDPTADLEPLHRLPGVETIERPTERGPWHIQLDTETPPQDVLRELVATLPPSRLELQRPSLEDLFVDVVTQASGDSASAVRDALHGASPEEVDS